MTRSRAKAGNVAYKLGQLAEWAGAELVGDPEISIDGVGALTEAAPGQIAFLNDPRLRSRLRDTRASAVLVQRKDRGLCAGPPPALLVCDNPRVAFAILSRRFRRLPEPAPGVHASAVVADDARFGADCVVGPNCTIGSGCVLGARCRLVANVALGHDVHLGDDVLVHPGAVIGADGFGFAIDGGRWVKIEQLGRVVIGDDVEIGANATIDRGAIGDTVIEEGVKIDNQVQIAHNVRIGAHTAIAGCAGIAGSTVIGRHCRIGGAAGIGDHLEICDGVTIAGMAAVNVSIRKPGFYASSAPLEPHRSWLRNSARIKQLDALARRLRRLEKAGGQGSK